MDPLRKEALSFLEVVRRIPGPKSVVIRGPGCEGEFFIADSGAVVGPAHSEDELLLMLEDNLYKGAGIVIRQRIPRSTRFVKDTEGHTNLVYAIAVYGAGLSAGAWWPLSADGVSWALNRKNGVLLETLGLLYYGDLNDFCVGAPRKVVQPSVNGANLQFRAK